MVHVGAPVASQQSRILRVDEGKVTPAENRGNKIRSGVSDQSSGRQRKCRNRMCREGRWKSQTPTTTLGRKTSDG